MKLALTIVLAYMATAIFYVWRDFSERNPLRRPFYVINYRVEGNWIGVLIAGMWWLPGAIFSAYYKRNIRKMGREFVAVCFFLCAVTLIWIFSN